ncbi:hypothetical protein ADZ36_03005 [Streptomyces fradiae]|uniref:Uncharacterized protein n=1 Tax=Streptomyces fradiae TaxID=1906 RepID=A0ACC4WHI3_STRFR|nr:hypothetical protein ADZ36_03005 [Streptomyces fradiae]
MTGGRTTSSAGKWTGSSRPADHRGTYMSPGGCRTAGRQDTERGHRGRFQRADGTWPSRWDLWTNR